MTKDELYRFYLSRGFSEDFSLMLIEGAEQFAKQRAIAFARWITSDTPEWRKGIPAYKIITNNDLYDIFIAQQNKDNESNPGRSL